LFEANAALFAARALVNVTTYHFKYLPNDKGGAGLMNGILHVGWQATLTGLAGFETAVILGNLHELYQLSSYADADRKRDSTADFHNNVLGRSIGRGLDLATGPTAADKLYLSNPEKFDIGGGVGGPGAGNWNSGDARAEGIEKLEPDVYRVGY